MHLSPSPTPHPSFLSPLTTNSNPTPTPLPVALSLFHSRHKQKTVSFINLVFVSSTHTIDSGLQSQLQPHIPKRGLILEPWFAVRTPQIKIMCFFHHGVVILLIRYVGLLFLTSSVKVSDEIFSFLDFVWWVCSGGDFCCWFVGSFLFRLSPFEEGREKLESFFFLICSRLIDSA